MFATLQRILHEKLRMPTDAITLESTLEEADLDSLALVELSLVLEKELGIKVSDDDISHVTTIGDIVALMEAAGTRA